MNRPYSFVEQPQEQEHVCRLYFRSQHGADLLTPDGLRHLSLIPIPMESWLIHTDTRFASIPRPTTDLAHVRRHFKAMDILRICAKGVGIFIIRNYQIVHSFLRFTLLLNEDVGKSSQPLQAAMFHNIPQLHTPLNVAAGSLVLC